MLLELKLKVDVGENFISTPPTQAELDWLYYDFLNPINLSLGDEPYPVLEVSEIKLINEQTGPEIPKITFFSV
jgi:hypothetical protein